MSRLTTQTFSTTPSGLLQDSIADLRRRLAILERGSGGGGGSSTVVTSGGTPTPDATTSVKGKIQLTGDIGGAAGAVTVTELTHLATSAMTDRMVSDAVHGNELTYGLGLAGQRWNIGHGTYALPVTTNGPTFRISSTQDYPAATGNVTNGADYTRYATFMVTVRGKPTTLAQPIAGVFLSFSDGTTPNPNGSTINTDANALQAIGQVMGPTATGRGLGATLNGRTSDSNISKATALELGVENFGTIADTAGLTANIASRTMGIWLHTGQSTEQCAAAIQIGRQGSGSKKFDTGIFFDSGNQGDAIVGSTFRDKSSSHKSVWVAGSHDQGSIVTSFGAGPTLLGTTLTNALAQPFNSQRILQLVIGPHQSDGNYLDAAGDVGNVSRMTINSPYTFAGTGNFRGGVNTSNDTRANLNNFATTSTYWTGINQTVYFDGKGLYTGYQFSGSVHKPNATTLPNNYNEVVGFVSGVNVYNKGSRNKAFEGGVYIYQGTRPSDPGYIPDDATHAAGPSESTSYWMTLVEHNDYADYASTSIFNAPKDRGSVGCSIFSSGSRRGGTGLYFPKSSTTTDDAAGETGWVRLIAAYGDSGEVFTVDGFGRIGLGTSATRNLSTNTVNGLPAWITIGNAGPTYAMVTAPGSGKVGIGTLAPGASLSLGTSAAVTAAEGILFSDGAYLYSDTAGRVKLQNVTTAANSHLGVHNAAATGGTSAVRLSSTLGGEWHMRAANSSTAGNFELYNFTDNFVVMKLRKKNSLTPQIEWDVSWDSASESADPTLGMRLDTTVDAMQRTSAYSQIRGFSSSIDSGTTTPVVGSPLAGGFYTTVNSAATPPAGSFSEACYLQGVVIDNATDANPDHHVQVWGFDTCAAGPPAVQSRHLVNVSVAINNRYNGSPSVSDSAGVVVTSGVGPVGTDNTYPVDAGVMIVGATGAAPGLVTRLGFTTALRIGGGRSIWLNGVGYRSRIGTGILISDYETVGLKIAGRQSGQTGQSATPPDAISIGWDNAGAASTNIHDGINFGGDVALYRAAADVLYTPDSFGLGVTSATPASADVGTFLGPDGAIDSMVTTSTDALRVWNVAGSVSSARFKVSIHSNNVAFLAWSNGGGSYDIWLGKAASGILTLTGSTPTTGAAHLSFPVAASSVKFDAGGFISAANAGTGLKIGNATNDKIGFYAATPIVQQTGVAVTAAGIHAALVSLGLFTA